MVSNSTASLHLMSARAHSIFICGDGSFEDGVRSFRSALRMTLANLFSTAAGTTTEAYPVSFFH